MNATGRSCALTSERGRKRNRILLSEDAMIAKDRSISWLTPKGPWKRMTVLFGLIPRKLSATEGPSSSTNIFSATSTPAIEIKHLAALVFSVTGAIFVVVATLLVFVILRYRSRGEDETEPPQVYGSNQVELAWTVIPV